MTATEVLRKHQKQCDEEGIEVQVSRQALDEVLDELEKRQADRKQDCVAFFRWFWNAPGTNAEQGYDEWLKEPEQRVPF